MKILFFIDCLSSGGKERRLVELMKALRANTQVQFELAVMSRDIHYKEVFDLGVKIHYVIRKSRKDLSVFNSFYGLCKDSRPDIVHCWDGMTAIYSVPACRLLRIKLVNGMVINTIRAPKIRNTQWLRARLTFPFSNVIIGNSQAGLDSYSSPSARSFRIYNGFDFDRTRRISPREAVLEQLNIKSEYIIGMVATFYDQKDYKTFYKAAQLTLDSRKDVLFLAIGDHTNSDESKRLIGKEYAEHFRLLGKKTGIESYINIMDICVLATFTEGISNSILEYMALGKPVIATDGGGTREIVQNNETGFLVGPSDPQALSEKFDVLLKDGELRRKMGITGKARVYSDFSIEKMTTSYISIYTNLVKRPQ